MESNWEIDDAQDPQVALDAIGQARADVAEKLITPWWYHPVLGLLVAGFVLLYAFGNVLALIIGIALYFAGIAALISSYRRMSGLHVNGMRSGKASLWAWWLVALFVAGTILGVVFARFADINWPAWLAAGFLFVAVILLGRSYDAARRAELREAA